MFGEKICHYCELPYLYPEEGGTRYCRKCRGAARAAQERRRRALIKKANDPKWKKSLCLPLDRLPSEVSWEWACGICGMKHKGEDLAVNCCSSIALEPVKPHYATGGFIVWCGETIKRNQLVREGILPRTPSALAITIPELISVAGVAAS